MNRNQAGRLVKRTGYLSIAEKCLFLMLLETADNATCEIPKELTPTVAKMATWLGVTDRAVRKQLSHLEAHGWLDRDSAHGRGHRSRYRLVPEVPGTDCTHKSGPCVPVSGAGKTGTQGQVCPGKPERGVHIKPERGSLEKRNRANAFPQVSDPIARRDHLKGVVEGSSSVKEELQTGHAGMVGTRTHDHDVGNVPLPGGRGTHPDEVNVCAVAGCTHPARRACRTCADHMAQEMTA